MKTTEIITKANIDRFDEIVAQLASAYKVAFAGEPWFEVSKCPSPECSELFSACDVGTECESCASVRAEAYSEDELAEAWYGMVESEDALVEVDLMDDMPLRATIARPTTPLELFERKYSTNPAMSEWLSREMPREFTYIEDTFADRNVMPKGNLKDRGRTLGRIGLAYGGLLIVTRTINPAVITATARDMGSVTTLNIGTLSVGRECNYTTNYGFDVPDERTLLQIDPSAVR